MTSNRSWHATFNHKLVWKYRSIRNPYIQQDYTTSISDENDPIVDVPNVQPIPPPYNEVYLSNRLRAFERDGWKCTQCDSREMLEAHHVEPVPKGTFDPSIVHRVENLLTLCAKCHSKLPKNR